MMATPGSPGSPGSPRSHWRGRLQRWARDPRAWLTLYIAVLTAIAFWPVPVDRGAGPVLRAITHLVPWLTYERIEYLANVALFVPFGVLLTLIVAQRWIVLPIALVATVTIEFVQSVALSERTSSVADIVANAAGACVGILIVVFAEHLRRASHVED